MKKITESLTLDKTLKQRDLPCPGCGPNEACLQMILLHGAWFDLNLKGWAVPLSPCLCTTSSPHNPSSSSLAPTSSCPLCTHNLLLPPSQEKASLLLKVGKTEAEAFDPLSLKAMSCTWLTAMDPSQPLDTAPGNRGKEQHGVCSREEGNKKERSF